MSVLRYYGCIDLCIRIFGSLACNIFSLISVLCLVLCCDIYHSTLISIMYPACMITVHDRKSRALHMCTTPNRLTGFTPLFLVYGADAIIPADIEFDSPRHAMYTEAEAKEDRKDGVDLRE